MSHSFVDPFRAVSAYTQASLQYQRHLLAQLQIPLTGDVTRCARSCFETITQMGLLNLRMGAQIGCGSQFFMAALMACLKTKSPLFTGPSESAGSECRAAQCSCDAMTPTSPDSRSHAQNVAAQSVPLDALTPTA
jgi:hypothetical protein